MHSKMQFFFCRTKIPFLGKKIKIISLSWNFVPRPIRICRIQCWYLFFLFLTWSNPFCANMLQKIKIVTSTWKLVSKLIPWWCSVFPFLTGNTLLVKFVPKKQDCQFKLKFGTETNSSIQNSIVAITFSVFDQKISFLGRFGPKNQNYQFKLKLGT